MLESNGRRVGYCANVHPGRDLDEVKTNLDKFATNVRQQLHPKKMMGVGLWLSATTLQELQTDSAIEIFDLWLAERGLVPFTFNGFPFGDFHQDVVKHEVYQPTWAQPERLDYTLKLAEIQRKLLIEESHSTISTVPIGWPTGDDGPLVAAAAENFRRCAQQLNESKQVNGHHTQVAIEPEPGCILDTAEDVVEFFRSHLLTGDSKMDEIILDHITICHDVCHSAVMFESQQHAIESYRKHGIRIGKVQVSSAVEVDFRNMGEDQSKAAFEQLKEFNEPRYLHQTCVQDSDGSPPRFFEDLSLAIDELGEKAPSGVWRVHFHVPIFAENLNAIGTTQNEIIECMNHLGDEVKDFEVETYAWNVLPDSQRNDNLADGIAKELQWFYDVMNKLA
jgi:sugar phosphate isomerase/epimerase